MAPRVPGIIVRVVNDTGIIAPPLYQRYPTIIGEGDPYKAIDKQQMFRTVGSVDAIPTMSTVNEIVSVGDLPGQSSYVDGTDYTLSGNNISWLPAGSAPTLGDAYYLAFTETRAASAYTPMLYLDENLIYADHGNAARTNAAINDVSVGGSLVLNAGANGVIIAQLDLSSAVDPDAPTNNELETAFIVTRDLLDKITDYKLFLIPMSSGTLHTTTAANIFFNHAVLASEPENKQERTVMASLPVGTTYQAAATFAQSYAHERMVAPYTPGSISETVGYGFTTQYDTRFYAAALSGKQVSVGIGRNISDEIIPNVSFDDNFTPAEAKYLVQHGVSPAKITGGIVRNIMSITTDPTSALTEDLGVQDTADYVKKYWRDGLWDVYKNAPTTLGLPGQVKMSSVKILNSLVDESIVADYKSVSVTQDPAEPRKLNVTGKIQPAIGLQYMDVTFTFVLSFT